MTEDVSLNAYLECNEGWLHLYWIKWDGVKILGKFIAPSAYAKAMDIQHRKIDDIHFHYPQDGDYHLSFKTSDTEYEYYDSYYSDKIKLKKINKQTKISEKTACARDVNDESPAAVMVPLYRPPAIAEYLTKEFCFSLPSVGLLVENGRREIPGEFNFITDEAEIKRGASSLIISPEKTENWTIFCGHMCSYQQSEF